MCTPFPRAQSIISIFLEWEQWPIVTTQRQDNGIFSRELHKTDKIFEPLRKAPFLDPSSLVRSRYWTWWSAIQEISLHVAPRKHQKRRHTRNGGIHEFSSCHEWAPLRRRQRDPLLTLKVYKFAYFMLKGSEARFLIDEWAMGREFNQPQNWLKYVEKRCDVCFRDSLHSCCRSNLGLAQPQSRMAAHKVTQPLPACCPLLYENERASPFSMASSKAFKRLFVVSPRNFPSIIRQ